MYRLAISSVPSATYCRLHCLIDFPPVQLNYNTMSSGSAVVILCSLSLHKVVKMSRKTITKVMQRIKFWHPFLLRRSLLLLGRGDKTWTADECRHLYNHSSKVRTRTVLLLRPFTAQWRARISMANAIDDRFAMCQTSGITTIDRLWLSIQC